MKRRGIGISGIVVLKVDDSLALGTPEFMDEEEKAGVHFKSRPRKFLHSQAAVFNGV